MQEKKIRNVTAEEFQRLKTTEAVPATPLSMDNNQSETTPHFLKPKTSQFEPEPIKINLPSGKIFTNDGFLYIRKLSTSEENILLKSTSEGNLNQGINKIFSSCIKSDINIQNLPLIDKTLIFISIIALTYGSEISIKDIIEKDCSSCRSGDDVYVDLINDLQYSKIDDNFSYPLSIVTNDGKFLIKFRFPSIKEEELVSDNTADFIKKITFDIIDLEKNISLKNDLFNDIIEWLSVIDKKNISKKLFEISKFGNDFSCSVNSCTNEKCLMKNKYINLNSEQLLLKMVKSISENLSI